MRLKCVVVLQRLSRPVSSVEWSIVMVTCSEWMPAISAAAKVVYQCVSQHSAVSSTANATTYQRESAVLSVKVTTIT